MSEQPRDEGTQRGQPRDGQAPRSANVPQPNAQQPRPVRIIRVPSGKHVRVVRVQRQPGVPGVVPPVGGPSGTKPPTPTPSTTSVPRQVVVRRRHARRKRNLMPVLATSLVLLLGGGTYTLWRSSQTFDGGQITAGDLDLQITDQLTWYDVSPDRADSDADLVAALNEYTNGEGFYNEFHNVLAASGLPTEGRSPFSSAHVIDCIDSATCPDGGTWKMVPGDTIIGLVKARMTLEGDNLVAGLGFDCDASNIGEYGELVTGNIADLVTAKTDLYVDPDTSDGPEASQPIQLASLTAGIRPNFLGYFEAPSWGQDHGVLDANWGGSPVVTTLAYNDNLAPRESVGVGDVTLMITIHFSENATDRELATLPLAEVFSGHLSLSQVRGLDTPGQFIQSGTETPDPEPTETESTETTPGPTETEGP